MKWATWKEVVAWLKRCPIWETEADRTKLAQNALGIVFVVALTVAIFALRVRCGR